MTPAQARAVAEEYNEAANVAEENSQGSIDPGRATELLYAAQIAEDAEFDAHVTAAKQILGIT